MKKILLPAFISGVVLFALSYLILLVSIRFLPGLVEEYYNPVFWPGSKRSLLFYIHPFILSIALSLLWNRVKSIFKGVWYLRGWEFGVVYALVATLPAMWICFSSLNVTFFMVVTWFAYGLMQAMVSGLILARMNP